MNKHFCDCKKPSDVFNGVCGKCLMPVGARATNNAKMSEQSKPIESMIWHKGEPPHPFNKEWFIAKTIHGEKVVLIALPEEYSYDYKTADETYIKKENIVEWMQFPDSDYIPFKSDAFDALSARCAELEKENEHLKSQVFSLELGRREMFAAESLMQNHELESLRAQILKLDKEYVSDRMELEAQLSDKERELAEVKNQTPNSDLIIQLSRIRLDETYSQIKSLRAQNAELEKQLGEKEADHKLIMASVERQRDLNDRQSAELKLLREDWVKLKSTASKVVAEWGSDGRDWPAIAELKLQIADLKYKGE